MGVGGVNVFAGGTRREVEGDGDPSTEIWLGANMKMSLNRQKPLEINLRSKLAFKRMFPHHLSPNRAPN
jgi:hypothetical protein